MYAVGRIHFILIGFGLFPCFSGLTCYHCNGVRHPRFCDFVERCSDDQICQLQKITDSHGFQVYNMGCIPRQNCKCPTPGHCQRCCSEDLCNSEGCGETGYSNSSGIICYSCNGLSKTDYCGEVTFCNSNQVCYIEEKGHFNEMFYNRGCKNQLECTSKTAAGSIFGRRYNRNIRSTPTRTVCCKTTLCNQDNNLASDVPTSHRRSALRSIGSKRFLTQLPWRDCGLAGSKMITFNYFDISPKPLELIAPVYVTMKAQGNQCIDGKLALEVNVDQKREQKWTEFPCISNFGTCFFDDICNFKGNVSSFWKNVLTKLGFFNVCQLDMSNFNYHSKAINLGLQSSKLRYMFKGDYRIQFKLLRLGQIIGCLQTELSVNGIECTERFPFDCIG